MSKYDKDLLIYLGIWAVIIIPFFPWIVRGISWCILSLEAYYRFSLGL